MQELHNRIMFFPRHSLVSEALAFCWYRVKECGDVEPDRLLPRKLWVKPGGWAHTTSCTQAPSETSVLSEDSSVRLQP